MQKSTTVQLVRDEPKRANYCIYTKGGRPIQENGYWRSFKKTKYLAMFCPDTFESFLPTSLHLPPGGGPVDITITIKDSK